MLDRVMTPNIFNRGSLQKKRGKRRNKMQIRVTKQENTPNRMSEPEVAKRCYDSAMCFELEWGLGMVDTSLVMGTTSHE
jgi:hypothetical protein